MIKAEKILARVCANCLQQVPDTEKFTVGLCAGCFNLRYRHKSVNKIKFAILTPGMGCGGAEQVLLSIVKNVRESECIGIVSRSDYYKQLIPEAESYCPVYVEPSREGASHRLQSLSKNCDLFLTWGEPDLSELKKGIKRPFLDTAHGACQWTAGTVEKGAEHHVAVSNAASMVFAAGVAVTVIPNGIEPARVNQRHDRVELLEKFDLPTSKKFVLQAGRFSPEKRPGLVAEVIEKLPEDYHLLYTGPDCGCKETTLRQYANLIPGRCTELPLTTNLADYLTLADCLVLLSETEGLPLIVLEAFYRRVPVVACAWPAMDDILQHGKLCWTVPLQFKPEQAAGQVRAACRGGDTRVELAKRICDEQWTASRMAARYEDLFARILGR